MATLFYMPFRPAYDGNGKSLPGAQVWFTLAGTNTAADVYSDAILSTPRTNPVAANGVGRIPATYMQDGVDYRVRVYEADAAVGVDTPLEEYDPYTGAIEPAEAGYTIVAKSATYSETTTAGDLIILASGTFTINLPTAVDNVARITVKLVAAGTVTLDGSGAETIDGSATLAINTLQAAATIVSDGTNWRVISKA